MSVFTCSLWRLACSYRLAAARGLRTHFPKWVLLLSGVAKEEVFAFHYPLQAPLQDQLGNTVESTPCQSPCKQRFSLTWKAVVCSPLRRTLQTALNVFGREVPCLAAECAREFSQGPTSVVPGVRSVSPPFLVLVKNLQVSRSVLTLGGILSSCPPPLCLHAMLSDVVSAAEVGELALT